MTGNTHFWLRLVLVALGLSVGIFAFASSATIVSKTRKKLFGERLESIGPKQHTQRTGIKKVFIGGLVVGCLLGWFGRDLWLLNNLYVSSDLYVIDHPSNDTYRFLDAQHNLFPKRFCDYIPDLDNNSKISYVFYEDRGSCWSLSHHKLTFKVVRNPDGGKPVNFSQEINQLLGELR